MKAIVCVDRKWGIGKDNDLLFHIKLDMAYFKEKTNGKVVVMGSNTLKSLPGGNPLKGRTNIVLFPKGEKRDDCIVVDSLPELLELLKGYNPDDVFIIGGATFYRTMLPYCSEVLVTKVEAEKEADVFFANLDNLPDWEETACSTVEVPTIEYVIRFKTYKNSNVKPL